MTVNDTTDTTTSLSRGTTGAEKGIVENGKDVAQSTQNSTITFEPTNGMLKWFDTAVDLGYSASISDVSKESGLDRHNWYNWLKEPGFVEWWDGQWQAYFNSNRWKLKAIGMKQSERNYDYWHDMMMASGQLQENKGTNVQVNTFIGDKKNQYGL